MALPTARRSFRVRAALARRVRRWLVVLSVVIGALSLSPSFARAEPIRLWHAYRGLEEKALEQVLSTWEGDRIEPLALPHEAFATKLSAAIPLGDGPDLFIDAHERLGDYRGRGLVVPAGDALAGHDGDSSPFRPYTVRAVELDGTAFGVPLSQKCLALYVNTDLVSEVPADLESIAALGSQLPEGVYPLVYEAESAFYHAAILGAFGGSYLGPEDAFGFVGEPAERSLGLVRGLISSGAIPADADGALVTQLFRTGRAAFAISGPWLATDLADADLSYRVALLPKVRATGQPLRPLLTVEAVMLSPDGAKRPQVRQLARHLASIDAAAVRQSVARIVSARRDVELPADDEYLKVFTEQAKLAEPMSTRVAMRATWEPANQAIKKVLRGDTNAGDALREAVRRYDDVRRPLPEERSPTLALVLLGALSLLGVLAMLRRARQPEFRRRVRRSLPAYRYVAHAVFAVGLLVFVPLIAGATISLFAGRPGDQHYVGIANFVEILTARGGPLFARGSFYLVLCVTVLWALLNVALHLAIGLLLGVVLSRPTMRIRGAYRVLLILPWAVPNYVTALAWKGMFHRQFGAITGFIELANDVFGTDMQAIAWFSQFSTAFTANLATNVWLGFPFMMVVTIAALTSVPSEVLEAAEVDGAGRLQRFFLVTLPIISRSLMPAVLLGAIWTFNMFNVVFLVSGGEPDGQTEILVSEAYRWAFTRQARYGYAAAYAVLIFLLLFMGTKLPGWLAELRAKARARRLAAMTGGPGAASQSASTGGVA
jgi:arabinogalactan oligomer/maltooligosaccharide transport system permease protein